MAPRARGDKRPLSSSERLFARVAIREIGVSKARIKELLRTQSDQHLLQRLIEAGEVASGSVDALLEAAQDDLQDGPGRDVSEHEDDWLMRVLAQKDDIDPVQLHQCIQLQADGVREGRYHSLSYFLVRDGHLPLDRYLRMAQEMAAHPDMLLVRCPHCQTAFKVSLQKLGRRMRCRRCRESFVTRAESRRPDDRRVASTGLSSISDEDLQPAQPMHERGADSEQQTAIIPDAVEVRALPSEKPPALSEHIVHEEVSYESPALDAADDEAPPTRPDTQKIDGMFTSIELEDYEILEEIARGGMGIVFKARQKSLDRIVALKVLKDRDMATRAALKRFLREAQSAAKLSHPNIVTVYEVHDEGELPYFAMDYIEGEPLDALFAEKRLPLRRGVEILVGVCNGVHHSHTMGIIHRDIKPANIIVAKDGTPKITDFGLAKAVAARGRLTRSGHPIGTPYYMSPEQARGDRAAMTARSDVYSIGVILYETMCGRVPFVGRSNQNIYYKIEHEQPRSPRAINPRVPKDLEAIAMKAIAKSSAARYQSAEELAAELERWLDGEAVHTRAPGVLPRLGHVLYRHRSAIVAALVAALLAGLAGAFLGRPDGPQPVVVKETDETDETDVAGDPGTLVRSQEQLDHGVLDRALDLVEEYIGAFPDDAQGYLQRARVYYYLQNHESSLRDLKRVEKAAPGQAEASFLVGANHLQQGKADAAVSALKLATEAAPRNAGYHLYLGAAHYRKGDLYPALAACRRALQIDSTLAVAHLSSAWLYLDSQDHAETQKAARAVLAIRPWDEMAWMILSRSLMLQGDYRGALNMMYEMERHRPMDQIELKRPLLAELFSGGPYYGAGKPWPTGELGDRSKLWSEGLAAMRQGDTQKAQRLMERIVAEEGIRYYLRQDMELGLMMPLVARALGQMKELTGLAYFYALSTLRQGNLAKARSWLDQLLKHHAGHGPALLLRSRLALQHKDTRQTLDDTARLLSTGERTGKALLLRSQALASQNQLTEAEECLREAIQREPRQYELYLALGDLLRNRKRRAAAAAAHRTALKLEPAQPGLRARLAGN